MRKEFTFFIGLFILVALGGRAQDGLDAYLIFWGQMDGDFKDAERSPLHPDDVAGFDSVPRFAYNPDFRMKAAWVPSPNEKPFAIETTTSRKPRYLKVGELHFELLGVKVELPAYQNLEFAAKEGYANRIFVPFTDLSNGETTYMGGRYLDLKLSVKEELVVDFNLAYNPYCVYSDRYSCPIPPKENHILVAIEAGARVDEKH